MKSSMKMLAVLAAVCVLVGTGTSSLWASGNFDENLDLDAMPIPCRPTLEDEGFIATSQILPSDEVPAWTPPQTTRDRWTRTARKVLKRIQSLDASLGAYVGETYPVEQKRKTSALRREVSGLCPGRAVETVLRRMKEVTAAYRSLGSYERASLARLSADRRVEVLDEVRKRHTRISRYLTVLRQRRESYLSVQKSKALEREKKATVAAGRAAEPKAVIEELPSGDLLSLACESQESPAPEMDSSLSAPEQNEPAPAEKALPPEPKADPDGEIDAAAQALGADLLRLAGDVATQAADSGKEKAIANAKNDGEQVSTLWTRVITAAIEATCAGSALLKKCAFAPVNRSLFSPPR